MALQQQQSLAAGSAAQAAAAGANNAPTGNKDPVTYERLRDAFIRELQHFHDTRGTSFKKIPKVSGKDVDLYKLYTLVTARGGWIQVNNKNEWTWLCEEFHLPSGCVNSGVGLKQIYLRYLDRYEKVHFLGEDGHQADDDDEDSRHRKWNARSLHSVPLTYNHNQHNIAESLREYNGLSTDLYKPSNYDKLALSLISPLPNEQDFAINVCTFLSNEGKHTLRLDKYPRLVNHLLAHAGVFDTPGTRQLFIECYSRVRNYSINSFWPDVLDSQEVVDLTDERIFIKKPVTTATQRIIRRKQEKARQRLQAPDDASCPMELDNGPLECDRLESGIEILEERLVSTNGGSASAHLIDEASSSSTGSSTYKDQNQNSIKFEDDDKDLFCVGRTLGTQDPYGQRVLQIAMILRNLSFTPENASILANNRSFLRFVLLCVRARWSNLHQLGYDTLGNVANEIVLKEAGERLTSLILSCVSRGIDSQDRFVVISCLEILNKISQQDLNEEALTLGLDDSVYELICRFLALSDIALLVYTLECLYALTSLGERPCTSVARVRGAIDTLVALVTVEAQSYGPKACILMRVVETVSSIPASQQQQSQNQPAVSQQATPSVPAQQSQASSSSPSSAVHHAPAPCAPVATSVNVPGATAMATSSGNLATPVVMSRSQSPLHQQTQQVQTQTQQQTIVAPASQAAATVAVTQTHTQQAQQVQPQQSPTAQTPSTKGASGGGGSRPGTPKSAAAKAAANSLQQQHAHQQIIKENEQFALGWLRANFELSPGVKIEQEELYKKYLGCCTKIGRRGVIAPLHFPRCVRSVFGGSIGPNPTKGENTGTLYYEGIRVRSNASQVTYPGQNAASTSTSQPGGAATTTVVNVVGGSSNNATQAKVQQLQQRNDSTPTQASPSSPILKAQLSAPPKPMQAVPTNSPLKAPNPVTCNVPIEPNSQVSVSHLHLSQALLASSAQILQAQPQTSGQQVQQVQVIVKDDGRGGATSSSIIKSLLATKVTVSGDCMPGAAATSSTPCVSTMPSVTNATGVASNISANQLITSNQVAQRQQQQQQRQQQLQQQQLTGTVQPVTLGMPINKANVKSKPTIVAVKKVQRLNGAKVIVTNNYEKSEAMETDNGLNSTSIQQTQAAVASITMSTSAEMNHVTGIMRVCRPNQQGVVSTVSSITQNRANQQQLNVCTPIVEDSDSTNNSLASSSGIGGSRDCSGVGAEEENSLTSFEGILLNGAPSNLDIDAQEDGSSKDSSSVGSKEKPLQSMMLADLLERKVDKEPVMNGILGKKDLVENHIKKVLKESSTDMKIKAEVSEDTLIEAPARIGVKRSNSDAEEVIEGKKPKYSNGTTSPDPVVVDSTTVSSVKSEEQDDEKEEKVTVSSTAANLYAALAADIIEDETDLEEPVCVKEETKPTIKKEVIVKEEPRIPIVAVNQVGVNQIALTQEQQQHIQQQVQTQQQVQVQQQHHPQTHQIAITQQQLQQQLQQGLIVAAPRQIVVQQTIQSNNQIVTIPAAAIKGRQPQMQPQVLQVQQGPSGQTHYVISGGVPGQNYVLAQPQTALVQGQAQTVLVAQQQGTNTKTIIILQPQAAAQPQPQKMVTITPQGQQVVVTQVPRPLLQSPAMGSIPPPLVPTSGTITQASIVVNSTVAQQLQQQQQQQIQQQLQAQSQPPTPQKQASPHTITVVQTQQTTAGTSSVPSRVVTPTPASTPPPTRPTTPQQAAATNQPVITPAKLSQQPPTTPQTPAAKEVKTEVKTATTSTSTEPENASGAGNTVGGITGGNKSSTSQDTTTTTNTTRAQTPTPITTTNSNGQKTITIKIDPNAFLCEWRGCLRQFKTPRKVYLHVCEAHCPTGNEESLCLWASCDSLKRRRFSLMTHLFDRHCCDDIMIMRRKQLTLSGKTEVTTTTVPTSTHHPGYAPNAAFHAIKRHALEFVNPKELMQRPSKPAAANTSSSSPRPGQNPPPEQDDNEGPVTKSIRLTAALILRNLVIYSAHGRRHLRAYEPHLAGVALSNVESSRTIAQVLYDMNETIRGHR